MFDTITGTVAVSARVSVGLMAGTEATGSRSALRRMRGSNSSNSALTGSQEDFSLCRSVTRRPEPTIQRKTDENQFFVPLINGDCAWLANFEPIPASLYYPTSATKS